MSKENRMMLPVAGKLIISKELLELLAQCPSPFVQAVQGFDLRRMGN